MCHIKGTKETGEFEKRVLRRMFGPKIDEVTGDENLS
jgi:hypothetical protein